MGGSRARYGSDRREHHLGEWRLRTGRRRRRLRGDCIEVAPLVYHITPYDLGKGFSIDSGWISTLDTAPDDGLLDISEIVSFRVDYSHPKGQDTLTDANATLSIEGSNANEGNLAISSTQILVLDESPADHLNFLLVEDDTSFARVFWRNNAGVEKVSFDVQFVDIQSPLEDQLEFFLPPGSIEVATVPEPSLLLLQWSSLLTLLWVAHRPEPAIRAPRDRG